MANWDNYTQKSAPEDADTLMIKDTAGAANKRTPFSGVWNWIVSKLTSAVISQLETTNKSIIPAINELNGKSHTIPDRFYMTSVHSEQHKKINIAFKSNARNFMLVFGSANQDPYVGVADVKGINEISDINSVVSLVRGDTPNSYVINCPSWSTFFIVGDKNYLEEAEITYSD